MKKIKSLGLRSTVTFLIVCLFLSTPPEVPAEEGPYSLPEQGDIIGSLQTCFIENEEETLVDLAIENDLGYNEIVAANPDIDPWYSKKNTEVTLPSSWILPNTEKCLASLPGPYYTSQIGSFALPEGAWERYLAFSEKTDIQDQTYLRLERHDPFYSIRSGLFNDEDEALVYHQKIKQLFPDAILISTHIRQEKILYPSVFPPLPEKEKSRDPSCIIANLAEFRLYRIVWREGVMQINTFPIGIGKQGAETIRGRYSIMEKLKDPVWIIPPSLQQEYPQYNGSVPPGPHNPLGQYALRLSNPNYLIHGTNKPQGIGRRVSHGCIRMYPADIEKLHAITDIAEEVVILYQPVKIGEKDGSPYIEVHDDYLKTEQSAQMAISLLEERNLLHKADFDLMFQALKEKRGIPVSLKIR